MSELGKTFPKKSDQKGKTENQCQNATCEQKTTSEEKFGLNTKQGLQ